MEESSEFSSPSLKVEQIQVVCILDSRALGSIAGNLARNISSPTLGMLEDITGRCVSDVLGAAKDIDILMS